MVTTIYAPINAVTRKPYNGINITTLTLAAQKLNGLNDPRWLTFLQAKQLGLKVKKGAHGTRVEFWKAFAIEQDRETQEQQTLDNDEKQKVEMTRKFYIVFHASQIEGIKEYAANN